MGSHASVPCDGASVFVRVGHAFSADGLSAGPTYAEGDGALTKKPVHSEYQPGTNLRRPRTIYPVIIQTITSE